MSPSLQIQRSGVSYTHEDVVIQFRCGDSCLQPSYGLLPWQYYYVALARHVGPLQKVTIIADPTLDRSPSAKVCGAVLRALVASLEAVLGCAAHVRPAESLLEDVALMVHARVFVASASSLGLFVAGASFGTAYVPRTEHTGGKATPCFGPVQYVHSASPHVRPPV